MTELPLVHLLAIVIGETNMLFVGFRVIGADKLNKIVSRNVGGVHACSASLPRRARVLALPLRCHQLPQQHFF